MPRSMASQWKLHRRCRILAISRYANQDNRWTGTAVILWKAGWEKHVSFLNLKTASTQRRLR